MQNLAQEKKGGGGALSGGNGSKVKMLQVFVGYWRVFTSAKRGAEPRRSSSIKLSLNYNTCEIHMKS